MAAAGPHQQRLKPHEPGQDGVAFQTRRGPSPAHLGKFSIKGGARAGSRSHVKATEGDRGELEWSQHVLFFVVVMLQVLLRN